MLPIIRKEIKLCEAAKVYPHSERSQKGWVYREGGEGALIANVPPLYSSRFSVKNDSCNAHLLLEQVCGILVLNEGNRIVFLLAS